MADMYILKSLLEILTKENKFPLKKQEDSIIAFTKVHCLKSESFLKNMGSGMPNFLRRKENLHR